jgi:hypothetical protein
MTTIAQNIKKTAVRFCLSLLFILGSSSLCQAQGVVFGDQMSGLEFSIIAPIQSSAPALSGWASSIGAGMEMSGGSIEESAFSPATGYNFVFPPTTPVSAAGGTPAISPEPSTLSLMLAGSAALLRFGRRKRSN